MLKIKDLIVATVVILLVGVLLGLALKQTENTVVAENLRSSGFVDEEPNSEFGFEGEYQSEFSGVLFFIAGVVRQSLMVLIPFCLTLRLNKMLRTNRSKKKIRPA